MAVSGTEQGETPESLVTPAFVGFPPVVENGIKSVLTTGLTTDRKIFDFLPRRGIMIEIEYPGVVQLIERVVWECRACIRGGTDQNAGKPCSACTCGI